MASTFITRCCAPYLLTQEETDAIDLLLPGAADDGYKLPVGPVCHIAYQIIKGRIPDAAMLQWITAAEKVDADYLMARVQDTNDPLDIEDVERTLFVGERGIYTPQDIQAIFGIT